MKTIFHYGGWGRNYGDMAIQHAMTTQLNVISKSSLNFIPIDLKQGTELNVDDIHYINSCGDAFIIGGGGMIMKGDGFDTVSGWQLNIDLGKLHGIQIPIVIYGIGLNTFPYDNGLSKKAIDHLRETISIAKLVSVRNNGTKRFLRDIGVSKKIKVIPDPAMFVNGYHMSLPFDPGEYLIGINWAGDRISQRMRDIKQIDEIKKISSACQRLLELKGGGKIVWIPHVSTYDLKAAFDFKECLEDDFFDVSGYYPNLYPEQYFYVPQIVGIYKKMNMVIAMRGHGNIISFGQGTRCIAYGDHQKVKFFSEEVHTPYLKTSCSEDDLFNEMRKLSDDKTFEEVTKQKLLDLNKEMIDFNHKILKLLDTSW